jgi:hypothetical protein
MGYELPNSSFIENVSMDGITGENICYGFLELTGAEGYLSLWRYDPASNSGTALYSWSLPYSEVRRIGLASCVVPWVGEAGASAMLAAATFT